MDEIANWSIDLKSPSLSLSLYDDEEENDETETEIFSGEIVLSISLSHWRRCKSCRHSPPSKIVEGFGFLASVEAPPLQIDPRDLHRSEICVAVDDL